LRIRGGLIEKQRPTQALFRIIIIEEAFKTGIDAEDDLITLAKKCCLSLNEVKIWVNPMIFRKRRKTVQSQCRRQKKQEQGRNNNDFNRNKHILHSYIL